MKKSLFTLLGIFLLCSFNTASADDTGTLKIAPLASVLQNDKNTGKKPDIKAIKKKADSGDAVAQLELGNCYYYGNGVEKNNIKAVEWLTKSAQQGNATAQSNLGECEKGMGVAKNHTTAYQWYKKAADAGLQSAKDKCNDTEFLKLVNAEQQNVNNKPQ
jgi:hypothetical protein